MRSEEPARRPAHAHAPPSLLLLLVVVLVAAAPCARAQGKPDPAPQTAAAKPPAAQPATPPKAAAITAASTPAELARAAFEAMGGERARAVKSLILLGSVDLYSPNSTQSISGRFGVITAGDRIRQEMQSPFFNLSMIHDGERSYSSMAGFEMPPASKFGLPVLLKFDREGYTAAALPDRKKLRAFRLTGPEGNSTDFYLDPATGRLARYEIPWGDYTFVTEFKSFKEQEGVLIPTQFVQRLDSRQGSFIAEFKVKEAKLNQELPADAFAIPNK
jgi:hypothetical protein